MLLNHKFRIIAFTLAIITLLQAPIIGAQAQTPGYAEIIEPHGGQAISGVFTIRGSASHPAFLHYQLSFALADDPTSTWFLLGEPQTNPIVDGGIGLWETTGIADGDYRLRLEVFLENEQSLVTIVEGIRIRNHSAVETSTSAPVAARVTATPDLPTRTPRPTPLPPLSRDASAQMTRAFTTGGILGLLLLSSISLYLFVRRRAKQRLGMLQMRRALRQQNRRKGNR